MMPKWIKTVSDMVKEGKDIAEIYNTVEPELIQYFSQESIYNMISLAVASQKLNEMLNKVKDDENVWLPMYVLTIKREMIYLNDISADIFGKVHKLEIMLKGVKKQ